MHDVVKRIDEVQQVLRRTRTSSTAWHWHCSAVLNATAPLAYAVNYSIRSSHHDTLTQGATAVHWAPRRLMALVIATLSVCHETSGIVLPV